MRFFCEAIKCQILNTKNCVRERSKRNGSNGPSRSIPFDCQAESQEVVKVRAVWDLRPVILKDDRDRATKVGRIQGVDSKLPCRIRFLGVVQLWNNLPKHGNVHEGRPLVNKAATA